MGRLEQVFFNRGRQAARESGRDFRADSLVAAAQQINLSDDKEKQAHKKRVQKWQRDAWKYYDEVGEIWFAMNFGGNALRKMILYPAKIENPEEAPVPLEAGDQFFDAANELLDRMRGDDGTHGELLRDMYINLNTPGEGHLVIRKLDQPDETWDFYNSEQLFINQNDRWAIRETETDRTGTELDASPEGNRGDIVTRIWRRHPRWKQQADSAMKAVLLHCEELLILSKEIRATGRARLNAGIFLIPKEAHPQKPGQPRNTQGGTNPNGNIPFIDDYMKAFTTPIEDEASVAGYVPTPFMVESKWIEFYKHLKFEREVDPVHAQQRLELIQRIANGIDLPADALLGKSNLNHWSAWQVDEDTFKAHLEPATLLICSALTKAVLRALLPEAEDVVFWYNPSNVVSHPNRSKDADLAFDRMAISWEAYRKYKGFLDDDAPDDTEIKRRIEIEQAKRKAVGGGAGGNGDNVEQEDVEKAPPEGAAIRAAAHLVLAQDNELEQLGRRLAQADHELRERVGTIAQASVQRVIERIGAKLRRTADGATRKRIDGIDNMHVAATLGQPYFNTHFVTDDVIINEGIEEVESRYEKWTSRTQEEVLALALLYGSISDAEQQEIREEQKADKDAGKDVLRLGLLAVIGERLFNPHPAAQPGEFDDDVIVPPGIIRASMARAGGNSGTVTRGGAVLDAVTGKPTGGVATGQRSFGVFSRVGLTVGKWQWQYGSTITRKSPFESHLSLDGIRYSSWEDDRLKVSMADSWLGVAFYFPGDHLYCQCDFLPVFGRN